MMLTDDSNKLTGWRQWLHLKLRFGLAKLPVWPVCYRLRTSGLPDVTFRWTRVIPFMDPVKGAFNFDLWGWDVRELRFLQRFLSPGMNFIDIGAHHGLYAVLAAKCIGLTGRVEVFEPAPPIHQRLRWHLWLNGVGHAGIHACAVGAARGRAEFFIPVGGIDTISSLRRPTIGSGVTRRVDVEVMTLDEFAGHAGSDKGWFVKLDVEGGELAVLAGAQRFIREQRPLWMFETIDVTAATWGTTARALVERFMALDHQIYSFTPEGFLLPHMLRGTYPDPRDESNCDLLAVPTEKVEQIRHLLADGSLGCR